jgi:flagellin
MGANASQALSFQQLGVTINLAHDANAGNVTGATIAAAFDTADIVTSASSNAVFRVGAEVGDDIALQFADMRASALGDGNKLDVLIASNNAVSTSLEADTLLQSVDLAIAQVSTFRAKLGAAQNQMGTAVNSIAVAVENLSASESRIRDADIAQVSSELVSRQIMQQAGVAVLSQANAAPQSVLRLLQG